MIHAIKAAISACSDCGSSPWGLPISEVAAAVGNCVATADSNEVASGGGTPALVSTAITDEPIEASMDEDSAASIEDDKGARVIFEGTFRKVEINVVPVLALNCVTDTLGLVSGDELNKLKVVFDSGMDEADTKTAVDDVDNVGV